MKNLKILSVLLLATALVILTSSVGAYMRKQTDTVQNTFVPAEVSCQVDEEYKKNAKSVITIKNTSTIDTYLRLRFVTYWIDTNGDIVVKDSKDLSINYDTSKWIEKDGIYHYKEPVEPGKSTSNLLTRDITLTTNGEGDDLTRQVVEVFAEAIQSLPEEAVESSWGVEVNDDGTLSAN